jgi:hypothetical protein
VTVSFSRKTSHTCIIGRPKYRIPMPSKQKANISIFEKCTMAHVYITEDFCTFIDNII